MWPNVVTAIATSIYAALVFATLVYVFFQFKELRSSRQVQTLQWWNQVYSIDPASNEAVRFARTLDVSTWEEYKEKYFAEHDYKLRRVMQYIEFLGIMHHSRAIDSAVVFGFFGDLIELWGTKLRSIIDGRAKEFGYPVGPVFGEYIFCEWRKWYNNQGVQRLRASLGLSQVISQQNGK